MHIRISDYRHMTIDDIRIGNIQLQYYYCFCNLILFCPEMYNNKYDFRFTVKRSKKCAWNFITTRTSI